MAAQLMTYPWGALTEQRRPGGLYGCYRTDDLYPAERGLVIADVRCVGTPILLVHGFADNRSAFAVLGGALRKHGFGAVSTVLSALSYLDQTRPAGEHATTPPEADLTIDTATPNAIGSPPSASS